MKKKIGRKEEKDGREGKGMRKETCIRNTKVDDYSLDSYERHVYKDVWYRNKFLRQNPSDKVKLRVDL